jgi:hypothetical protein
MSTLDELHQDAITKIEQAFPKKQPPKRVTKPTGDRSIKKELTDYLNGQRWDKLIDDEHIVYRMSEFDYLYYLPAFLLTALKQTNQPFALNKPLGLLSKFTKQQLEALLAFLECFIIPLREYQQKQQAGTQRTIHDPKLEILEDIQLRIMVRLDELNGSPEEN